MRVSRRGLALIAVLGAVMAPSAALGASKPRLQDVAKNTAASPTMAFGMDAEFSMAVAGKTVRGKMIGQGQVDRAKKSSAMSLDMSSLMTSMAAASGQPLPKQFQDPSLFKMQVIGIGTKVYMSFPMLTALTGSASTKPWVVVDATALGVSANDIAASQGADPTQGLEFLKGLGATATEVGTETIDGVSTTRYRATVSRDQLLRSVSPSQRARFEASFGASATMPVEVWVDDQGRARRIDMTMSMASQGSNMTMKMSYRFSKFGEPVTIAAPPASQVATAAENPILAGAIAQAAAQQRKPAA